MSSAASADDPIIDEISIGVPVACSMAVSSGDGEYELTIDSNSYGEVAGSTMNIACNDNSGFAVYAIGFTGDSYTDQNHTKLIGSPAEVGNISTGVATSGNTSDWAMWLTASSSAGVNYPAVITDGTNGTEDFTAYHVVPDTFTKVAYRAAGTDVGTNAEGSSITAHYMVFAASSQPAGTYTGQVKYVLVHPAIATAPSYPYTVSFDATSTSTGSSLSGTGAMDDQAIFYNVATVLSPNTFNAPSGYHFDSWNTSQDGTGTSYADGAVVTNITGATAGGLVVLYAIWEETIVSFEQAFAQNNISKYNNTNYYSMQSLNSAICSLVSRRQTITLIDSRDDSTYEVIKLEDGNCWMRDNLALDVADASVQANLTNATTNASNTSLGYLKGTTTRNPNNDPDGQYATAAASASWATNSYSAPLIFTASKNSSIASATITGEDTWKYGIYYNYCAVSAGSYCYGNGASATGGPTTDPNPSGLIDVAEDICPKNWRMPTAGGDYHTLYYGGYGYNSIVNYRTILHIPFSGYVWGGEAFEQGVNGSEWSSTWGNDARMIRLFLDNDLTGWYNRSNGIPVRCIVGA